MSYYNNDSYFGACLLIIICLFIFGIIGGLIFMSLWNWIAPIFWHNAPILTFWQSCGTIIFIAWISSIFKNYSSK